MTMPKPSALSGHLALGLAAGASVACLIACANLTGLAILASWASSVALILTSPTARASAPGRVGVCHVVAALVGLGIHALLSPSPWSIGLSVGVTVAIAMIGDFMHPPAIANAAFAFLSPAGPGSFVAAALLGGVLLAGFAFAHGRLGLSEALAQGARS